VPESPKLAGEENAVPYPVEIVEPMREELTRIGVRDLRTPEQVDDLLHTNEGTVLLFVNSVCGCAAGSARPGLARALAVGAVPDVMGTVFAGVDLEATERARGYFDGHPASSPQIALFRNRKLVRLVQRNEIKGRPAEVVAALLRDVFDRYCGAQV
jgi:putative YphP/YqiW family bacilliredoxin